MGNYPSSFIIGGMAQDEAMVCFYCFIHCFFVTIDLSSQSHFVIFATFSGLYLSLFLSQLWEGRYQGAVIMTQPSAHMQQFNTGNGGNNIEGAMGVFYGGSDRSIVQNSSFWTVRHLNKG